jgi:uncharacterized protein
MLIQLTIGNFLSFRDEVTFSMVGVNEDREHIDHLCEHPVEKKRSILPIAAIYGANGAGKSNLVEAVSFAKDLIVEGTRSNKSIPVSTFKLGNYSNKPSKFEFIFTYKGSQYSYGFKLTRSQILEEWLHCIPKGKKREIMYFERVTSPDKDTTVEFGKVFKDSTDKGQPFLDFIAEGTRPNQLFLTEAINKNIEFLMPITNWFQEVLTIVKAESESIALEIGVLINKSFTDFITEFLKLSGTGIDAVTTKKAEFNLSRHLLSLSKRDRDEAIESINDIDSDSYFMLNNPYNRDLLLFKDDEDRLTSIEIITQHRDENDNLIDFAIDEESEGTQRMIHLLPALFSLQEEAEEKVILLDELERRLHPLLSRKFIETAINCRGKKNQIVFTTHDTNLLDLEIFRRDEIWFVEKDKQGASSLYSLAEFKIKPDLQLEKGYLNGRFGAIPFFGNIQNLGWFNDRSTSSTTDLIEDDILRVGE